MPYYEWRGSGVFHDNRNDRNVEHGEVVELSERVAGGHDFVEVDEPEEEGETPTPDDDESDEITCADENCSRTVDEEGEKCWQHSDDE
jgi:hypothetical protein